jgi:tetratricopeptide (TPR) repeat protein
VGANNLSLQINELFQQEKWLEARKLLEAGRERDPQNHWLLTQLGVTFYEQFEYEAARGIFLDSLKILKDCPLTLWNYAGTLDALGKHDEALPIYAWLIQSNRTAQEDPCWESAEWTARLKADCAYRVGVCFRHLGKKEEAENWLLQYVDLLFRGIEGTYSIADVRSEYQNILAPKKTLSAGDEIERALRSTLDRSEIGQVKGKLKLGAPPIFKP